MDEQLNSSKEQSWKLQLALGTLAQTASTLEDNELKRVSNAFLFNLSNVTNMMGFPGLIVLYSEVKNKIMEAMVNDVANAFTGKDPKTLAEEDKKRFQDELAKSLMSVYSSFQEGKLQQIPEDFKRWIEPFGGQQLLDSYTRALLMAAVTFSWTALESLAKDLWITTLNIHPQTLANRAFKFSHQKGSQQTEIPFAIVAKHGFNLTSSMGVAFKDRFNFTDLSGIATAYRAIFEDKSFDGLHENQNLRLLSAQRNCIVHNGGIIDEQYERMTKTEGTIGDLIDLQISSVTPLIQEVVDTGNHLINYVHQWLQENQH